MRDFNNRFTSAYGHPPEPQAIFAYEAMAAVIAGLHQAGGQAKDRATVVHDFFALRGRQSVIGTYSIDSQGDTSLQSIAIDRVRAGRLVPATG